MDLTFEFKKEMEMLLMSLNISKGIANLNRMCSRLECDSILFNFSHNKLYGNIIYFKRPKTFLIGIKDHNVGWLMPVIENVGISTFIPEKPFDAICEYLDESDVNKKPITGKLFEAFRLETESLNINEIKIPSHNEIYSELGLTSTEGKKGDRLYFKNWRRNGLRKKKQTHPKAVNLNKTADQFGEEIRELCLKKGISSVWSTKPTTKSLDFMNTGNVIETLNNLK